MTKREQQEHLITDLILRNKLKILEVAPADQLGGFHLSWKLRGRCNINFRSRLLKAKGS